MTYLPWLWRGWSSPVALDTVVFSTASCHGRSLSLCLGLHTVVSSYIHSLCITKLTSDKGQSTWTGRQWRSYSWVTCLWHCLCPCRSRSYSKFLFWSWRKSCFQNRKENRKGFLFCFILCLIIFLIERNQRRWQAIINIENTDKHPDIFWQYHNICNRSHMHPPGYVVNLGILTSCLEHTENKAYMFSRFNENKAKAYFWRKYGPVNGLEHCLLLEV